MHILIEQKSCDNRTSIVLIILHITSLEGTGTGFMKWTSSSEKLRVSFKNLLSPSI